MTPDTPLPAGRDHLVVCGDDALATRMVEELTVRYGEPVTVDDPWGYGNSLEWATSSPPPRHNFTELPRIRSERPAFELHYPHMIDRMRSEAHFLRARASTR